MTLHKYSDRENTGTGPGTVDVRDWDVRTRSDDEDVGKVRDLLVDDGGKVRYLDVDLGIFSKRVLVPIERTTPDAADEVVWVDGLDKDGFKDIPKYDGDIARLNADYEEGLQRDYTAAESSRASASSAGGSTARGADRATVSSAGGSTTRRDDRTTASGVGGTTAGRGRTDAESERREEEAERVEATREASPTGDSRLARISELDDYEVADDHKDVRGWDVVASDDRKIGGVKDLVADTSAMKVRYLDVELDSDFRRSEEEGRVLIPIEQARIIDDPKSVRLDSMGSHQAGDIPTHRGTYDRDYETRVSRAFPTGSAGGSTDSRR